MKRGIEIIEKDYLKKDVPPFKVGDTVHVYQRIQEGDKSRLQSFEGVVISRRGRGTGETFAVFRADRSDSVEKVFLLHSPQVDRIVVTHLSKPKLKRARLYYLRKKALEA